MPRRRLSIFSPPWLPPPPAGEGRGGGRTAVAARSALPPPNPLPRAGGGALAALFGALALSALAISALALPAEGQGAGRLGDPVDTTRRLLVTVHTRNDRGRVYCGLWRGREGFPTERRHAVGNARDRTLARQRGVCVFEDVSPGEYAVAVFHDENANNDLDTNFLGIPSEGTGASNGAHNPFGPPGYDDARFVYPDTRVHHIAIHIRY